MQSTSSSVDGGKFETPNSADDLLGYYECLREDVIALVPKKAKNILSIGCAGGITEAALVASGRRVVGIEMNPSAARKARSRGLEVIEGDAVTISSKLVGETFDCLIYADVLEHMPDPEKILKEHVALLTQGGCIVISVPNFRHYSVLWSLIALGEFRYANAGIFDKTHVRITTLRSVIRWMNTSHAQVTKVNFKIYRRSHRLVSLITLGIFKEFLASQVLVVAQLDHPRP